MMNQDQLLYYDFKTKSLIPLCNKPECKHTDKKICNSYIEDIKSNVHYINGELYYMVLNKQEEVELYKEQQDGSERERIMTVMQGDRASAESYNFNIIGDYLYYSVTEETKPDVFIDKLYCKKLDGKSDAQVVFSNSDDKVINLMIHIPKEYSGKVYFNDIYYYDASEQGQIMGRLYSYDPKENRLETVSENINYYWFVLGNAVYYRNIGEGICRLDLSTNKTETVVEKDSENPFVYLSFDGTYMYTDNSPSCSSGKNKKGLEAREINVYDLDGKRVDTVSLKDNDDICEFGDPHYLVLQTEEGYRLYNKNQLGTGKCEWEELNVFNRSTN